MHEVNACKLLADNPEDAAVYRPVHGYNYLGAKANPRGTFVPTIYSCDSEDGGGLSVVEERVRNAVMSGVT